MNNSLNERSTARHMINGVVNTTALIAPRLAPGINTAITTIETLELINNLHVERVRNATEEQLEEIVEGFDINSRFGVM